MPPNPRQVAFLALHAVDRGSFADVALDRALTQVNLGTSDRRLVTELVYGCVRRQRTLDAVLDQLAAKPAAKQPPDLRLILHLGLYQLLYLDHIPPSAAVNTSVELAKQNGFAGLTGFVNGVLRQYTRLPASPLLHLPFPDPTTRLGTLYSYPDWIVQVWLNQLGVDETEQLCEWMNRPPHIDLRVNTRQSSLEEVEAAFQEAAIPLSRIPHLPQGLRLLVPAGNIQQLPGFEQGWWIVQDSSAQLVGYLVDPQPGQMVIDACAAPGGKTMHLAELMQEEGTLWACDRTSSRLKKLQQNASRLGLQSIQICSGDSTHQPQFVNQADRVLLDVPCSNLGTLNRHADARWRQSPETVEELVLLQRNLLGHAATWVRSGGSLIYSTCTLHPAENEELIRAFLAEHPDWQIEPPPANSPPAAFLSREGWIKVWSHRYDMDGFFMVRLKKS